MKRITLGAHNLEETVATTVEFLAEGGVVLLPTDTSYGLAADAARQNAVDLVFRLKGRAPEKAVSVITSGRTQAEAIAEFNQPAVRLWDRFLPGPLTLVLPLSDGSGLKHGSDSTVGLRYPKHDFAVQVAERLERPYTATSANRTGQPPAFTPDEFLDSLTRDERPHLVVDAGQLPLGPVSTVVDLVGSKAKVLREGAVSAADIQSALD